MAEDGSISPLSPAIERRRTGVETVLRHERSGKGQLTRWAIAFCTDLHSQCASCSVSWFRAGAMTMMRAIGLLELSECRMHHTPALSCPLRAASGWV
jgi:hypothetical protein